ncbi:hypothetical protein BB561_000945 [Smittium simulii]|uniref:Uncharacterized protein n=1 Tax=Smittium simulii TaxID=133385 RepID=A0A2T9YWY4_9FUNG|nr:hypothetical protein BB561_000945 [Smittium simulii]
MIYVISQQNSKAKFDKPKSSNPSKDECTTESNPVTTKDECTTESNPVTTKDGLDNTKSESAKIPRNQNNCAVITCALMPLELTIHSAELRYK